VVAPPRERPTQRQNATALLRQRAPSLPWRSAGAVQRMESGVVQADKKPCAICTMGQGLSGELKEVMLHSAGFSSCGPVVMFNSFTGIGGLFHFAAGRLEDQAGALAQMFKNIGPSEIHIPRRDEVTRGTLDGMMAISSHREESGQPRDDGEVLEEFFKEMGFKRAPNTAPRGDSYYVTANASGRLVIATGSAPEPVGDLVDYSNTRYPKVPPDAVIGISSVIVYGKNMYKYL
jgi:hypothetical protein